MTLSLLGVSDACFGERGLEGGGEALSFPRREGACQGARLARSSPLLGGFGHLMFPIHSLPPPAQGKVRVEWSWILLQPGPRGVGRARQEKGPGAQEPSKR